MLKCNSLVFGTDLQGTSVVEIVSFQSGLKSSISPCVSCRVAGGGIRTQNPGIRPCVYHSTGVDDPLFCLYLDKIRYLFPN